MSVFRQICVFLLLFTAFELVLADNSKKTDPFYLFDVTLPITATNAGNLARSLEQQLTKGEKSTIILRFHVPTSQENFGRGSSFGACFEIANLISGPDFADVRTVAYFPQSVEGHAILIALACHDILLAPDAQIGLAGVDEPQLNDTIIHAYEEMSRRRSRVAPAIAEKMLNPQIELLQVETEHGTDWITSDHLEQYRPKQTLLGDPKNISPAGQPGLFTADLARQMGLATFLADNLNAVTALYQTTPTQLRHVVVRGEQGRAIRIDLNGTINDAKASEVQRAITKAMNPESETKPADFICLWIDSPGGNLGASLKLASFLLHDVDSNQTRVIAYIPYQARSDAALIAAMCDEIVLGPNAVLGGDGATVFNHEQIQDAVETLTHLFSGHSRRNWSLFAAMIDPNLEVYQFTLNANSQISGFFSQKELDLQPDPQQWLKGKRVTKEGTVFSCVGPEGIKYWLADKTANDFNDFKKLYHLEDDPTLVKPGWADQLIRALASPGFAALLIFAGFLGVTIEMKAPGIGIGAVIAIVCFVLFFWSRYLGGTAGWLEIILLITGIIFILLEIFVIPGFGAFGIIGGLCVILSIVLASQTFIIPRNSYQFGQLINSGFVLVIAGTGTLVAAMMAAKWLHDLNKPKDVELIRETEKLADYEHLRGQTGETTTLLIPSGRAMINGELVDVVSEGDVIQPGTPILVTDVRGYKVIVREVS